MHEGYEVMRTEYGSAWIRSSQFQNLQEVDAIAFDCDGVLVDARRSYDATIPKVVDQLLELILGIKLPWKNAAREMISDLRRTGMFNNDWDTTYALIIFSILALPMKIIRQLATSKVRNSVREHHYSQHTVMAKVGSTVNKFCSTSNKSGGASEAVKSFVTDYMPNEVYSSVIATVEERLSYPGSPPKALLSTLFDEMYHGPALFRRMYGVDSIYYRGKGLIENERLLVKEKDLNDANDILEERRLAIITGRPYLATEHVLGRMLRFFDIPASLFLGDIDVHPELAPKLTSFRKPSGRGLIHVRETLGSDMLLYVGDSAEDITMVENAREEKEPALSAGVYGTSADQSDQRKFFQARQADLIVPSARVIPKILRRVRDEKRES